MTIKVDLLDRPGRRMGFDPVILFMGLIVVIFVIGFYVYGNSLEQKINEKKKEIEEVNEKIRSLEDKIPKIKELEDINKDLEAQINVIKQLVYDPIRYANLLDEIALIMPRSMFIQNLSIEPTNTTILINGLAVEIGGDKPLDTIARFMEKINNSKYFKPATLTNTSKTSFMEKTAYSFQIQVPYDHDAAVR